MEIFKAAEKSRQEFGKFLGYLKFPHQPYKRWSLDTLGENWQILQSDLWNDFLFICGRALLAYPHILKLCWHLQQPSKEHMYV